MGRYLAKRLLQFVPTLAGTLFLIHYLSVVSIQVNGSPLRALFGVKQPPQSTIRVMREQFNLDSPCIDHIGNPCLGLFWERAVDYVHLDLGTNYELVPVTQLIADAWPITLRLTVLAIAFEVVGGMVSGTVAGLRRDGVVDLGVKASTSVLVALPVFVLAVLVQLGGGVYIGLWLDGRAWPPTWLVHAFSVTYSSEWPWMSLVLPSLVLSALSLATVSRLLRTSLIENLQADYVKTARAKGLRTRRVIGVHTMRNSLIPMLTYIGLDFGFLITGAIVVEGVFDIPGIGGLAFRASTQGVIPVLIPIVTLLTLLYLVANLVTDTLYSVVDPRIRYD